MRKLVFIVLFLAAAWPVSAADVEGFVFDTSGNPVAGAQVSANAMEGSVERTARWMSADPSRKSLAGPVRTDAAGRFRLTALPERVVELAVNAEGFAPAWRSFGAREASPTITLEKAAAVEGSVTAAGRPVAGANVVWLRYEGHEMVLRTDDKGRFRIPDPRGWAHVETFSLW